MNKKRFLALGILTFITLVSFYGTHLNSEEPNSTADRELALNFFQKILQKNEDSELALTYDVLDKIEDNYVDLRKADPKAMFINALSYLQRLIGELYVKTNKDILLVKIGDKEEKFDLARLKNFLILRKYTKDAYTFIKTNLTEDIKLDDIKSTLTSGLVDKLDIHSKLLLKEAYRDLKTGTTGEFGGLGIVIALRKGELTIIAPIADTPADKVGIKPGDVIKRIGDASTVNMSLDEAVDLMRGPKGTVVTIYILRKGFEEPRAYTITRDIIKIKSVESVLLPEKIGYIKVKTFQKDTTKNLTDAIKSLEKEATKESEHEKKADEDTSTEKELKSKLNGLIVDLRNNPGGLLDQAVDMSDVFLDEGTIVSTVGLNNKLNEISEAHVNQSNTDTPLVVLVNEGSASASEIVAGAIKVNERGLVVGLPSFGKGTVQSLYSLDDDKALKLTIAQFLAGGTSVIQSQGITPDVLLSPALIGEESMSLYRESFMIHEEDLDNHIEPHAEMLVVPEVKREKSPYSVKYLMLVEKEEEDENALPKSSYLEKFDASIEKKDFNVEFAANILRKYGEENSKKFIEKLGTLVSEYTAKEEEKIHAALAKRTINWDNTSVDESKAKARDIEFTVSFDKKEIMAGDEIKIVARVKNKSEEALYRIFAISESENYLFDNLEFIFGKIGPNEEKKYVEKVKIPEYEISKLDTLHFKLYTKDKDHEITDQYVYLKAHELPKPLFAYHYEVIDNGTGTSKGNGNGIIEEAESIDLLVTIKNVGEGAAREVLSVVKNEDSSTLFLKEGRITVGQMKPNETKKITFNFDVKKIIDPLELKINIVDVTLNTYLADSITFTKGQLNPIEEFNKMPPIITVDKDLVLLTNKNTTSCKLKVEDNKKLKDIYVFVQDEKIFYKKIRQKENGKSIDLLLNLPLKSGKNEILFVARDYDNLESSKRLIIHREAKPEARIVNTNARDL